ncbi:hypothetical protein G7046_g4992 [Stylonectria norvegica]|nr:hypothetical protein G7046_g4992 [Stylonectria norvegica]
MDAASLTTSLLAALLPPDLVDYIHTHLLHPHAPLQVFKRQAVLQSQRLLNAAYPIVRPLLDRLLALMADNQGVVGVAVSLAVLAVVVVVLNWVRRLLLWWTRLTMRVAFWAVVLAVAAWVWERGVFESLRDVTVVGSKVVGYLAVLKDVWVNEYHRYEAQQEMAGRDRRTSGR